jgi:hypothetical protein
MSADKRLAKAKRFAARINEEIIYAIALHRMGAGCASRPDMPDSGRGEPWFPLVRNTLHIDLLMTLCRLHEHGHEDNATIPVVCAMIEAPELRKLLGDVDAANGAMQRFAELQLSGVVKRIRTLRDRVLAHNDMRQVEQIATSGDETKLLEESAWIAEHLHLAVAGSKPQFDLYRKTWEAAAADFWSRVGGDA